MQFPLVRSRLKLLMDFIGFRPLATMVIGFLFALMIPACVRCTSDVCMTAKSYNYECLEYSVTTDDGYILGLQRIPRGPTSVAAADATSTKQPVLLQHGIMMDGLAWVVSPPGQGLAFTLADAGFDVWIANARGSRPSRGHKYLSADTDPDYWAWTWVELANYDLAANVNFVFNITGQKTNYVGHSLGTLMALASLSQHKLVDKVNAVALWSPIAFLNHVTTQLLQLGANFYIGELLNIGIPEFVPQSQAVDMLLTTICTSHELVCTDLMSVLTGPNCCISSSTLDMFTRYEPQSTSTRNILHLAQMIRSGELIMFDYGNPVINIQRYGQPVPPGFNLADIPSDVPLLLSYGQLDALSDVQDVGILLDILKPGHPNVTVQLVETYAHADFIMAFDAREKIHVPLIDFFNRFKL